MGADADNSDIGNLVFNRGGRRVEVDPKTLRKPRLYIPVDHSKPFSEHTTSNACPLVQNGGQRPTVETPKHHHPQEATESKSDETRKEGEGK
ncbi:hypothetical protein C6P41_004095 [Kluyveromyces marxianus]|nr:hypothetical protein C6P43_004597 [Kluyveromyces marxianus]KAG0681866.1 hypothetical protein C6P41_004095 [Kluyveromyces marxianus]